MSRRRQPRHADQASLSAYAVALTGLIVMLAYSFKASNQVAALGMTCQAAAFLLATPELLRPLRRLGYFKRPSEQIRVNRNKLLCKTLAALLIAILLVLALLLGELFHWGNVSLSAIELSAVLIGFLAMALAAAWMFEAVFEEASDEDTQQLMSRLLNDLGTEWRWAIAGTLFLVGTVLQFGNSYFG